MFRLDLTEMVDRQLRKQLLTYLYLSTVGTTVVGAFASSLIVYLVAACVPGDAL